MRSLRRKTLLFAFLAAMLMCVFTILLSFSFAEDGDTREAMILPASDSNYVSNIDLIIENSHDGKVDDSGKDLSKFYIVEVGSKDYTFTGTDVSPLYKMLIGDIESSNVNVVDENSSKTMSTFSRFVIDMHSSKYEKLKTVESIETLIGDNRLTDADIMVNDKIVYTYYKVSDAMDQDACVKDLGIADLVYLSDPPSQPFDGSYDLPEAVKIQLDSVASAKFTPFIIDDYTKAGQSSLTNKSFATLGSQIFKLYGPQRFTVDMDRSIDIDEYLNRKSAGSLYLPIIKDSTDNWEASVEGGTKDTAKFLVIRNNNADNGVMSKFTSLPAGLTPVAGQADLYQVDPSGAMFEYGYSGTNRPSFIKFEVVNLGGDASALSSLNFENYDQIIIEKGVAGVTLSDDLFNSFASLVFANAHIIYDKDLPSGSGGSTDDVDTPPNYKYVFDKVATSNGTARFTNVLVTTYDKMNIYAAAITPGGVEDIVNILNGGNYRGSGGKDDTTNTFNVLEIQPCYPIDMTLAKYFINIRNKSFTSQRSTPQAFQNTEGNEWYYLRTNGVSSLTTDEISYNGVNPLSSMLLNSGTALSAQGQALITGDNWDNITDYYAWELSNAKIAHATGRPINSVKVTHMSSIEFNSSRETIADTYDMIYIGGDDSSLRFGTTYFKNGKGEMTGNDFSDIKYEELEDYADLGLPIVFSKQFALEIGDSIEAGTNVEKFYAYCLAKQFTVDTDADGNPVYKGNVIPAFNQDDTIKIPNDGTYGTTFGGMVTVFNGTADAYYVTSDDGASYQLDTTTGPQPSAINDNEAFLKELLGHTACRPKFVLTERPISYQEGNPDTSITSDSLVWTYKVTDGGNYIPHVYIDDNTDGNFDDEEEAEMDINGNTVSCEKAANFYGAVYWKFTLTDQDGNIKASVVDISKVAKQPEDEKMKVNLLQLISEKGFGKNAKNTIYFCTECQETRKTLKGNRFTPIGKYSADAPYNGGIQFNDTQSPGKPNIASTIEGKDSEYTYVGNNNGIHIHNFGIVKYDHYYELGGVTGTDNWQTNWADELLDEYDFNTEILTLREYEAKVADIHDKWSGISEDDADNYQKAYAYVAQLYDDYYTSFYNYYVLGQYYSDSSGRYYKLDSGTAVSTTDDSIQNDLVRMSLLTTKICDSRSAYDQYMADFDGGKVSEECYIDVRTASNPAGTVTPAQLKTIFDYCESNKTGLGLNLNTLNNYICAQTNLKNMFTKYVEYVESHPNYGPATDGQGFTHDNLIDELHYEIDFERYSEFKNFTEGNGGSIANNKYGAPDFTFTEYSINSGARIATTVRIRSYNDVINYYNKYFNNWRDAKIIEQYLRESYIRYLGYSSWSDFGNGNYGPDFTKTYSCVVVGAAEDMAEDDIQTDEAVDALKKYVQRDGHLLLFHETITNSGKTPNMTNNLRAVFGQDIYAEDEEEEEIAPPDPSDVPEYRGRIKISFRSPYYSGTVLKEVTVDAAATEVSINFNANNADYINNPSGITITDNAADNAGNYAQHNIVVKVNATNVPSWLGDVGYVFVNDNDYGKVGATANVRFSTSILDPNSGGGGGAAPVSNLGLTQFAYNPGDINQTVYMNKYVNCLKTDIVVPNTDSAFDSDDFISQGKTFTDRATRVNKGVVTLYPFMISNDLKISPTHPSSFAANIYDKDMVVWYTLDGGSIGTHSSHVAADPHDGADNYFIYSYGNVVYCGAGHTLLTGKHRNNNDERRLLINVIVNSAHRSFKGPNIKVFDYVGPENDNKNGTVYKNDKITVEGGEYVMTVGSQTDTPNFTYQAKTDSTDQVKEVKIYFDLTPTNPTTGVDKFKYVANTDKLIYNMKYNASGSAEQKSIARNLYKSINNTVAGYGSGRLQLDPSYFKYENNTVAYIVVAVETNQGKMAFKRIKIKLAPKMYDLT